MRFIVEIPDDRFTDDDRKNVYGRMEYAAASSHRIKKPDDLRDEDLAWVYLTNSGWSIRLEAGKTLRKIKTLKEELE